jgi:hypothetical protein
MAFASCHGLVGNNACWAELGNTPKPKTKQRNELDLNPSRDEAYSLIEYAKCYAKALT